MFIDVAIQNAFSAITKLERAISALDDGSIGRAAAQFKSVLLAYARKVAGCSLGSHMPKKKGAPAFAENVFVT